MSMNYQSIVIAEGIPLRVWGDLTAVYRERDFNADSDKATDWLSISTINASSYIWKPWFALVNGSFSLTTDNRENSDQVTLNNKYANGKFRLNLFPGSRFPFLFYAEKRNNERYDEMFARDIVNTVVGMRQQYTSLDGKKFYSGKIEHNKREDIDQESFIYDVADFKARYKMENNMLYGDVGYSKIEKPNRDDGINYAITGRHSYADNSNFTLENMVSTTQSYNDYITNSNDTQNDQLSSFLLWRPGNKQNLNVTGSLRISELTQTYQQYDKNLNADEVKESERSTININQGLIYNYSPKIIFTETLNGTRLQNESSTQFIASEAFGATYNSGSIENSIGYYNWYAAANINRQHGDNIATEKYLKNQLGHSLSKDIFLLENRKIQSSFNQSAAYDVRTNKKNTSYLNHSITVNWSESNFMNRSSIRFTFTDVRNVSIEKNSFQLINLQFFHDYRISRYAHLIANVTLQKSQVTTDHKTTETHYYNGQVSYTNSRSFNVPGLSFKSELRINNKVSDGEDEIAAKYGSYRDNMWRNEMVYHIGLFETRMSLDYVKNGSEYDRVIKIQLTRSFGEI